MPELDVDIAAQLGIQIGESEARLSKQIAALDGKRWFKPYNLPKGGQANSSGILILDFHGPAHGFVWAITRVSASAPALASQPTAAIAYMMIGPSGMSQGLFSPGGSQFVSSNLGSSGAVQWPVEGYWNNHQFFVQEGDAIWMYITGLTSGEAIIGSIQAWEVRAGQEYLL